MYIHVYLHLKNIIEKKKVLLLTTIAALFMACGSGTSSTEAGDAKETAVAGELSSSFEVNASESEVSWKATKITGQSHTGTVAISSGKLAVTDGQLSAGNFVLDMTNMTVTDADLPEEKKAYLLGHLTGTTGSDKDKDFFQTADHPTSSFEITEVAADSLSGNLTIQGISKGITIPYFFQTDEGVATAKATFSIDRTDWGIKYGSGTFIENLGDNAINDAVEFTVSLNATK
jgi:polyisoprenoid-binding protein YceI